MTFAENLAHIEDEIAAACRRAGRPRSDVQLMAVSKTHPVALIREAIAAGLTLFGENRVQEFAQKAIELGRAPGAAAASSALPSARFHLIGHLQSNKAAKAAEIFDGIDSVDSLRLAERLNDAASKRAQPLPVLLEIKLSPEESKTGLDPGSAELAALLERLPGLAHLKLQGLMTVPPWSEDPEHARPCFRELRTLRGQLAAAHPRLDFSTLSMGMSGDFAVAIEEGSTVIRIGTALFGKREYSDDRHPQ